MTNRLSRMWGKGEGFRAEDYVGADEAKNERIVRDGFGAKAKRYLNRLPLAQETVAMYFCLLDPKTPIWVKGAAAAALAYFILPVDGIP
ncbi:YkvA family protein, partial [Singulisphaera rosea]